MALVTFESAAGERRLDAICMCYFSMCYCNAVAVVVVVVVVVAVAVVDNDDFSIFKISVRTERKKERKKGKL